MPVVWASYGALGGRAEMQLAGLQDIAKPSLSIVMADDVLMDLWGSLAPGTE